jgi:ABC-type Mn2+/Zn2+ transport system ATPase subunit
LGGGVPLPSGSREARTPSNQEPTVLSIKDLTKTYRGDSRARRRVSLQIPPGRFGLVRPNGAGKSTLMKILATLLEPDDGATHINGIGLVSQKDETRKMLGHLPQESWAWEFVVDRKPTLAGIEPYNKLIGRNADDKLIRVEEKK